MLCCVRYYYYTYFRSEKFLLKQTKINWSKYACVRYIHNNQKSLIKTFNSFANATDHNLPLKRCFICSLNFNKIYMIHYTTNIYIHISGM